MGPRCPFCSLMVEFTEWEMNEIIYAPKFYCCSSCLSFFCVEIDKLEAIQIAYKEYCSGEGSSPPIKETEEDWKKARKDYDSGNY